MATVINNIRQDFPGTNQWHQLYPWFPLGQLLRAVEQKNTPDFHDASQKAAIYFNDMHRLHWLLNQQETDAIEMLAEFDSKKETQGTGEKTFALKAVEERDEDEVEKKDKEEDAKFNEESGEIEDEIINDESDEFEGVIVKEAIGELEAEIVNEESGELEAEIINGKSIELEDEILNLESVEVEDKIANEESAVEIEKINDEINEVETEKINEEINEVETEKINEEKGREITDEDPGGKIEKEQDEFLRQEITPAIQEETVFPDQLDAVVAEIFVMKMPAEITMPSETDPIVAPPEDEITVPQNWQEDGYDPDNTDAPEETETNEPQLVSVMDIAAEKFEGSPLSQSLAEASKQFKEESTEQELVFATGPYHTVDYFASQGIRLELEPKADDKFGQQLKSFTSWLKQMKRLPAIKMADKEPDPVVADIATHSLEKGEIVTESMAEVLMMQGKQAQAVEVWQKLSLLHPEKSHYFASLIEKTKV